MLIYPEDVCYGRVAPPVVRAADAPKDIGAETYQKHHRDMVALMKDRALDSVVIYADREHGANFGFFTGFEPRFEEACLVLHAHGGAALLLGNENYKMHSYLQIKADPVKVPFFSLPNQPMDGAVPMDKAFEAAGIRRGQRVGVIGWKLFSHSDGAPMFDAPHFIVEAVRRAAGTQPHMASELLMHPAYGLRAIAEPDEIALYEFGASAAASCVFSVLETLDAGKTEQELATQLSYGGQPLTCYSMCAAGKRFENGVVFPRNKAVAAGESFTVSMGLRGGLTCRAGYAARSEADLPADQRGYLCELAIPYFAASATWYATIGIGVTGGALYAAIDAVLPKRLYGWELNPGHLGAQEEWLSSPVFEGSSIPFQSGMLVQMDIIPRRAPYAGTSAEDGVLLADDELQKKLRQAAPDMMARMDRRRGYMIQTLGIPLAKDVLPLSDTAGYMRPLMLSRHMAMRVSMAASHRSDR